MAEFQLTNDETDGSGSHFLVFTSLNLILLTFFVSLCALGTPLSAKELQVLSSVDRVFAKDQGGPSFSERALELPAVQVPGLSTKSEQNMVIVTGPLASLFEAADDQIRAEVLSVFTQVAAAASAGIADVQIISEPAPGQAQQLERLDLRLRQAASLHRFLLDAGADSKRISIRVAAGNEAEPSLKMILRKE